MRKNSGKSEIEKRNGRSLGKINPTEAKAKFYKKLNIQKDSPEFPLQEALKFA